MQLSNLRDKKSTRKKEAMSSLIKEWENSQEPVQHFCDQRGIVSSTFYYWLKKYRSQPKSQKASSNKMPDFINLEVIPDPVSETVPFAELTLTGGSRITLFREVSPAYIQSLLSIAS